MPRHITLNQAKKLRVGQTLYHLKHKNADGTAQRWRVNGKVKTWKTKPHKVQVPIKHGMYAYDYLTEHDLHLLSLTEPKRVKKRVKV
jgi:hypothetical protein